MTEVNKTRKDLNEADARGLIALLRKIQANEYWHGPIELFQEMQKTVSRLAFEIVIIDDAGDKPKVLLYQYFGTNVPQHTGLYALPGGFDFFPEDEIETINRKALDEIGISVECLGIIGLHKWKVDEHPFGARIMSLYALCKPLGRIDMQGKKFFTREEMLGMGPIDMDPKHPHRKFLDRYLQTLEAGKEIVPLPFG